MMMNGWTVMIFDDKDERLLDVDDEPLTMTLI